MTKLIVSFCLCLAWSLSATGLKIVSRAEWQGQEPDGDIDDLKVPVSKVIISHTATGSCSERTACDHKLRIIQKQQMLGVSSFSDIAYNFVIGNDGNVYEGRGWNKVGAHTRGQNIDSIGIAFIGSFDSQAPSEEALIVAKQLIDEGVNTGKLSSDYKLFGHRQFSSTNSPGDSLYAIIKKWPHWSRRN